MKKLLTLSIVSSSLFLTACDDDSTNNNKQSTTPKEEFAIIQQATFGTGSNVIVADAQNLSDGTADYYADNRTDFFLTSYKDHYFYVGKNDIDTINKYDPNNPNAGFYGSDGYSLNTNDGVASSNVHGIGFISDTKAYLTRYAAKAAWIANPEATNASDFKTGEIDLSAYVAADDTTSPAPEMDDIHIYNNKAFVIMQRIGNATSGFTAVRPAYAAVIDTYTNQEIDTKKGKSGLKGIELKIKNPQNTVVSGKYLYIQGIVYSGDAEFDGGLVRIDMETYEQEVIYDAKAETGKIFTVAVINDNQAYVSIYHGWKNNSLAKVEADGSLTPVEAYKNKNITMLTSGPAGNLWLGIGGGNGEDAKLYKLSKSDLSVLDSRTLTLDANNITFVSTEAK